jgi:fatty-acyl-CoA synthase
MAAIALSESVASRSTEDFLNELILKATTNLPVYARPHFVRILDTVAVTSTFKYQKSDLVKEGFDPDITKSGVIFLFMEGGFWGKVAVCSTYKRTDERHSFRKNQCVACGVLGLLVCVDHI